MIPPATLLVELDGEPEIVKTPAVEVVKASGAEVAKTSTAVVKSTAASSSQVKRKWVEGVPQQQSDPKRGQNDDRGKAVKGSDQQSRQPTPQSGQSQGSPLGSCKLAFNWNLDKPICDDPAAAACLMRQFNFPEYRLPMVSRMHGVSYYRSVSAAGSLVSFTCIYIAFHVVSWV